MPTGSQSPDISDVIREYVKAGCARIHTALPAVVVTYDATTQKATVQPVIRPRIDDPNLDVERVTLTPIPPIPNVPVLWRSGGGPAAASTRWAHTAGLLPGDPVTLLIAERSTDEWRTTGAIDNLPLDARRFDLSDAIVIPGGRSFNPAAGLTAPLVVGTEVDAGGAQVLSVGLGGSLKLGDAVAIDSALKGTLFEADLAAWLVGLDALLFAMLTPPVPPASLVNVIAWITAVQAAAIIFVPGAQATFKAAVASGIHQSLKVKVSL